MNEYRRVVKEVSYLKQQELVEHSNLRNMLKRDQVTILQAQLFIDDTLILYLLIANIIEDIFQWADCLSGPFLQSVFQLTQFGRVHFRSVRVGVLSVAQS